MRATVDGMVLTVVRFRSGLSEAEVLEKFASRAYDYERVPGLIEKLYLRYRDTEEFGAVYVWRDEESLAAFQRSDLGSSIADAYQVEGELESTLADVAMLVTGDGSSSPRPSAWPLS